MPYTHHHALRIHPDIARVTELAVTLQRRAHRRGKLAFQIENSLQAVSSSSELLIFHRESTVPTIAGIPTVLPCAGNHTTHVPTSTESRRPLASNRFGNDPILNCTNPFYFGPHHIPCS